MSLARVGIIVFVSAVVAGPVYTVAGYSPVRNLISELGAQQTPNSWVMIVGFLALGAGLVLDGAVRYRRQLIPFMAFGLFMGLAGPLAHKPITSGVEFSEGLHSAHAVLGTLAGLSLTVGFVWQAVSAQRRSDRVISLLLAAICFGFPLSMLAFPEFQGAIQRLMYLLVFTWLWIHYPGETRVKAD